MNIIFIAIPFFIVLMIIEILYDRVKGTGYYRLNDTIGSLSAGILSRTKGFMSRYLSWMTYPLLLGWLQVITIGENIWSWILAFVLYDFCYYWSHRMQHTINLLWGVHVVHHSSEEYNLSTALRQTSTGVLFGSLFYAPLAILGVSLPMLITVGSLNLVYQFWVHTRFIPKLGWFEWFFVSPSNHRVHHAQNWTYIDKNFGGVFILWDRFFGTFQEELDEHPVVYGISMPLNSWNPFWANFQVYWQLIKDSWRTESWFNKFKVFFAPTGWRPDDVKKKFPIPLRKLASFKKFDQSISSAMAVYLLLMYIPLIAYSIWFMLNYRKLATLEALLYFLPFGLAFINNNYLLIGRNWAIVTEWIKWAFILVIPFLLPLLTQKDLLLPINYWLASVFACLFIWIICLWFNKNQKLISQKLIVKQ